MSLVLLFLTAVLMYMPFITSVMILHVAFFALGLCTAITDTGCQIMTRKLHGAKAGPWLGANTVVFGISGALVPLIGYLTGSIFIQYVILAAVSCLVASFLIILPAPEKYEGLLEVSHMAVLGLENSGGWGWSHPVSGAIFRMRLFGEHLLMFHSGNIIWNRAWKG